MKCWGYGYWGQLGQGNEDDLDGQAADMGANLPAIDLGTGRTAVALASGEDHTYALLDNRAVKCWGHNTWGQLGLDDRNARGDHPDEMGDALPCLTRAA